MSLSDWINDIKCGKGFLIKANFCLNLNYKMNLSGEIIYKETGNKYEGTWV